MLPQRSARRKTRPTCLRVNPELLCSAAQRRAIDQSLQQCGLQSAASTAAALPSGRRAAGHICALMLVRLPGEMNDSPHALKTAQHAMLHSWMHPSTRHDFAFFEIADCVAILSLIHISEPTRLALI
eukprot:9073479-Alexandrium_andersonii.AAC.1